MAPTYATMGQNYGSSYTTVIKSGRLVKSPVSLSILGMGIGRDKERLIKLLTNSLEWYEDEGKPALGDIMLHGAKVNHTPNQLIVSSDDKRIKLKSDNPEELRLWAEAIRVQVSVAHPEVRSHSYESAPLMFDVFERAFGLGPCEDGVKFKTSSQWRRHIEKQQQRANERLCGGFVGGMAEHVVKEMEEEAQKLGSPSQRIAAVERRVAAFTHPNADLRGTPFPPHLKLGLTLGAMKQWVAQLPSDVVARVNEANKGFPPNEGVNGYVNQWWITQDTKADGMAWCESRQRQANAGVGVATVFVSWFLNTSLAMLIDALEHFLMRHPGLDARHTHFWCVPTRPLPDIPNPRPIYLALLPPCTGSVTFVFGSMVKPRKPTFVGWALWSSAWGTLRCCLSRGMRRPRCSAHIASRR